LIRSTRDTTGSCGGSHHRYPQGQPLACNAIGLQRQCGREAPPDGVRRRRIFDQLLRKHPLDQAGNDRHVEFHPADLFRRRHVNRTVAASCRPPVEPPQPFAQHQANLVT
jgi:hypothetical protein